MSDEIGTPPPTWPSGWYPSHTVPGQHEYWDGARWTGALRPDPIVAPPPAVVVAPTLGKIGISTWIGAGLVGLLLIIALASGGPSGLLVWAGIVTLFTALYVVITGRRSWLRIPGRKAAGILVAAAVVVTFVGGGIAARPAESDVVALVDSSEPQVKGPSTQKDADAAESAEPTTKPSPKSTPKSSPTPTVKKPSVTTKNVTEVQDVPFTESFYDDGNLAAGTQTVVTAGAPGKRTIIYKVTYTDGVETGRVVASDTVTVAPVTQVVANGTYVAPAPEPEPVAAAPSGCDGNYSGACVPIASDVDCAGGTGNGPAYVQGPVWVVGSDVYDLDRDGDGIACD